MRRESLTLIVILGVVAIIFATAMLVRIQPRAEQPSFGISSSPGIEKSSSSGSGSSSRSDNNGALRLRKIDGELLGKATVANGVAGEIIGIAAAASKLPSPIVLTFSSPWFFDALVGTWLPSVEKCGRLGHVIVIGTNQTCSALFENNRYGGKKVACLASTALFRYGRNMSRDRMWSIRSVILSGIIAYRIDVVISDLDAIWRKDPIPLLSSYTEDFVFSAGFGPKKASGDKSWPGYSLCSGFGLVRSTDPALSFFHDFLRSCSSSCNDQTVFNFLLHKGPLTWHVGGGAMLRNSTLSDFAFSRRWRGLSVRILSFSDVVRGPVNTTKAPDPFVVHD